jgi:hypothetical protein
MNSGLYIVLYTHVEAWILISPLPIFPWTWSVQATLMGLQCPFEFCGNLPS